MTQVVSVEDGLVRVLLEHDGGETVADVMAVRKRYEYGHLLLVETCVESLSDLIHKKCGKPLVAASEQVEEKSPEEGNAGAK